MNPYALITGGSGAIGSACAKAVTSLNFTPIIGYNNSHDSATATANNLQAIARKADVTNPKQLITLANEFKPIDLLICAAGIANYELITDISDSEIQKLTDVNFIGTLNAIRAVLPDMLRRKKGNIITISSIWGITGASCEAVYSATKAAVIGLTKALAKEVAPSGIRVNCVAPGIIDTPMMENFTPEELQKMRDNTPQGRLGSTNDVAQTVNFLASDNAKFITGQVLSPNGGLVC